MVKLMALLLRSGVIICYGWYVWYSCYFDGAIFSGEMFNVYCVRLPYIIN